MISLPAVPPVVLDSRGQCAGGRDGPGAADGPAGALPTGPHRGAPAWGARQDERHR